MKDRNNEAEQPQEQPQTQQPTEIQVDPALEHTVEKDLKPSKETRQK